MTFLFEKDLLFTKNILPHFEWVVEVGMSVPPKLLALIIEHQLILEILDHAVEFLF